MTLWASIGLSGDSSHRARHSYGSSTSQARRMEEQTYLINGKVFATDDAALQDALARVYGTPVRPRCLCVDGGVEMYVSKFKHFVIKRMPQTGSQHCPTCPSYELPPSESGLGQMLGKAIIERGPDSVELRLDFPLTRRLGRGIASESKSLSEVTVACEKLSLRGLLHYLWQRAGTAKYSRNGQGIYLSNHGVCSESAVHFRAQLMDRMDGECPSFPVRKQGKRSTHHLVGTLKHAALPNRGPDHRQR